MCLCAQEASNPEERLGSPPAHRGVHDDAESFSGSTLVDELQDLLRDGQRGRRAEGGQLLFILLLLLRGKTDTASGPVSSQRASSAFISSTASWFGGASSGSGPSGSTSRTDDASVLLLPVKVGLLVGLRSPSLSACCEDIGVELRGPHGPERLKARTRTYLQSCRTSRRTGGRAETRGQTGTFGIM